METLLLAVLHVIVGAVVYLADLHMGTRFKRGFYNMTHKDPQKEKEVVGYIHGRPFVRRLWAAAGLSILDGVLMMLWGGSNVPREFGSMFLEILLFLIGFYAGPAIDQLLARRSEFYTHMDRLEAGDMNVKERFNNAAWRAYGFLRELFRQRQIVRSQLPDGEASKPHVTLPPEPLRMAIPDVPKAEPETDPRDAIRKYLNQERR